MPPLHAVYNYNYTAATDLDPAPRSGDKLARGIGGTCDGRTERRGPSISGDLASARERSAQGGIIRIALRQIRCSTTLYKTAGQVSDFAQ